MTEYLKTLVAPNSAASMMRFVTVLVVLNIMAVWTVNCVIRCEMVDFPWGVITVLGIVITGKAVQKFGEIDVPVEKCDQCDQSISVKDKDAVTKDAVRDG